MAFVRQLLPIVLLTLVCQADAQSSWSPPLRSIEQQLRLQAGLRSRPDGSQWSATARPKLHDYMHELHAKMQQQGGFMTVRVGNATRNLGYISAVHSFPNVQHSQLDDCSVFHFNVSDIPHAEELLAAELRLHVPLAGNRSVWQVYEVLDDELRLLDVLYANDTLLALDLTRPMRRWYREQRVQQLALRPAVGPPLSSVQANIVAFTRSRDQAPPQRAKRSKRDARRLSRQRRNRKCSLQQMYVDFERVGWTDWIIAPLNYQAGICVGTCTFPLSDQVNATNHAIVQALVHSVNDDVPSPCCVPTKLAAIALLFQDQATDKVILKNYSDMVAEACGCR